MWRNLKFLHMWSNFKFYHMIDVEKSEISPHLACVWWGECLHMCEIHSFFCKFGFVAIYALLSQICFVAIYALLCGEKFHQQFCLWKKTNVSYDWHISPNCWDYISNTNAYISQSVHSSTPRPKGAKTKSKIQLTYIYPPIVGSVYPIPLHISNWHISPHCLQCISNTNICQDQPWYLSLAALCSSSSVTLFPLR